MNEENRLKKERTALIALTSVIYVLIEENLLETLADYAMFALLYGPKAEEKNVISNPKAAVSVISREKTARKKTSIPFSGEGCKDGSNWYVYCSNNPLTIVDPTGLYDIEKWSTEKVFGTKHDSTYYVLDLEDKVTEASKHAIS